MSSLFNPKIKTPTIPAPDPAIAAGQSIQARNVQKREGRQKREKQSRQAATVAAQGRGGPITLFKRNQPSRFGAAAP